MLKQKGTLILLMGYLFIQGCGTTSNLKPAAETEGLDFSVYERVVVLDFQDATDKSKIKAKKLAKHEETLKMAVRNFADRLAAEIRLTEAYSEVLREQTDEPAMVISGAITRYKAGNAAARLIVGFGAGSSYFDAEVEFSDGVTEAKLGSMTVDKNSWVLGGGLAAGQSVERFMDGAARKIAKQLAEAKLAPGATEGRRVSP